MTFERLTRKLGCSTRLETLRELAHVFSRQPPDSRGYSQAEIETARVAMPRITNGAAGAVLPIALADWWASLGRVPELTSSQNRLHSPEALHIRDDVLVIYTENQSCAFWGIRVDDLARDDPPVVYTAGQGWNHEADSISQFALTVGLTELCLSTSQYYCSGYLDDVGIAALRHAMRTLPVRTLRWPSPTRDAYFLADADTLALMELEFVFAVSTRSGVEGRLAGLAEPGMIEWTVNTGLE